MASFVGDKTKVFNSEVAAISIWPKLQASEFQSMFGFLEDETEQAILLRLRIDSAKVRKELAALEDSGDDLATQSQILFSDSETAETLFKQAVYSLMAANLIGNRMATDATKEAADRQESLTLKQDHLLNIYRESVLQLQPEKSGYTFELI